MGDLCEDKVLGLQGENGSQGCMLALESGIDTYTTPNADTLRHKHGKSKITFLSSSNPCGMLVFFLEGVYLNPSARSAVYLLIPPSFLMECAAHGNERSCRWLTPPARYRAREVAQNRSVSSDSHTHMHTLTHTLMAKDDLSNYRSESPIGGLKWGV